MASQASGTNVILDCGKPALLNGLIIWSVPIAIRGEKPGGEKFINYFAKKYPGYAKKLDFKLGTLNEVIDFQLAGINGLIEECSSCTS